MGKKSQFATLWLSEVLATLLNISTLYRLLLVTNTNSHKNYGIGSTELCLILIYNIPFMCIIYGCHVLHSTYDAGKIILHQSSYYSSHFTYNIFRTIPTSSIIVAISGIWKIFTSLINQKKIKFVSEQRLEWATNRYNFYSHKTTPVLLTHMPWYIAIRAASCISIKLTFEVGIILEKPQKIPHFHNHLTSSIRKPWYIQR